MTHAILDQLKKEIGIKSSDITVNITKDISLVMKPISPQDLVTILRTLSLFHGKRIFLGNMTDDELLTFRNYVLGYAIEKFNNITKEDLFPEEKNKNTALTNYLMDNIPTSTIKDIFHKYYKKWSDTLYSYQSTLFKCPKCGWATFSGNYQDPPKYCIYDKEELEKETFDPLEL